jgi:hypothetical protein
MADLGQKQTSAHVRVMSLYPRELTLGLSREMSALCHKRTFTALFDHLVSAAGEGWWNGDAERA